MENSSGKDGYENLIKLENDLNEDYIMDDLSKLINIDDFPPLDG